MEQMRVMASTLGDQVQVQEFGTVQFPGESDPVSSPTYTVNGHSSTLKKSETYVRRKGTSGCSTAHIGIQFWYTAKANSA